MHADDLGYQCRGWTKAFWSYAAESESVIKASPIGETSNHYWDLIRMYVFGFGLKMLALRFWTPLKQQLETN